MIRVVLIGIVLCSAAVSGCAHAPLDSGSFQNKPVDCLTLERDRLDDLIAADSAALDASLDDSLRFIHASGRVDTKKTYLSRVSSGELNYVQISLSDLADQSFTSSCIVTGRSDIEIVVGGTERNLALLFTSTWVDTAAGWRLAGYQSTAAPR